MPRHGEGACRFWGFVGDIVSDLSKKISPYKASLTREQFLFYEMRTTARLMAAGLSDSEIMARITRENLFQCPTERSIRSHVRTCLHRLKAMNDAALVGAVCEQPSEFAKQICLYAMMKQHRLVWDFMTTVIGEKFRTRDYAYGRLDLNVFMIRLQEQDDCVAAWSDKTVMKIKQVLNKNLVENGYLDSCRADHLNPVMIHAMLERSIRCNHDEAVLPAFNCFDG
ncbi:MAG: DUF1819 family protein [Proteobacteria bacterium]|nr:DUF1819 family protein [Pseudomonadota bacterium]